MRREEVHHYTTLSSSETIYPSPSCIQYYLNPFYSYFLNGSLVSGLAQGTTSIGSLNRFHLPSWIEELQLYHISLPQSHCLFSVIVLSYHWREPLVRAFCNCFVSLITYCYGLLWKEQLSAWNLHTLWTKA